MINECYIGDTRDSMRQMIADGIKVQCVVTSPPYFGLRDYNVDGQIGLESTPAEYIETMVGVFRLVRELLADDGTVWMNMGDSYGTRGSDWSRWKGGQTYSDIKSIPAFNTGLKPKDLMGMPWRLAFALQADGWYLRQDIVWHKPNPMPESVTDRCTKAHEYLFLLTKKPNYFYDAEAVREPVSGGSHGGAARSSVYGAKNAQNGGESSGLGKGWTEPNRNKRSVWTIQSQPYPDAHFATFPEALVEPCILAGTSQRGHCPECGKRWVRVVERGELVPDASHYKPRGNVRGDEFVKNAMTPAGEIKGHPNFHYEYKTTGWQPSCTCSAEPIPDIVFDPFMGSGTVARVAQRLGRSWLGCELSGDYVKLQNDRTRQQGMVLA